MCWLRIWAAKNSRKRRGLPFRKVLFEFFSRPVVGEIAPGVAVGSWRSSAGDRLEAPLHGRATGAYMAALPLQGDPRPARLVPPQSAQQRRRLQALTNTDLYSESWGYNDDSQTAGIRDGHCAPCGFRSRVRTDYSEHEIARFVRISAAVAWICSAPESSGLPRRAATTTGGYNAKLNPASAPRNARHNQESARPHCCGRTI